MEGGEGRRREGDCFIKSDALMLGSIFACLG